MLVKRGELGIFEQSFGVDTSDYGLTQDRYPSVGDIVGAKTVVAP